MRIKRGKRLLRYQVMRHSANGGSLERRPSRIFQIALAVIDGQLFTVPRPRSEHWRWMEIAGRRSQGS
jgi:hypothetical protein